MSLKLYNTYSKQKEVFKPLKNSKVTMYNCGPTVYDYVHIGNISSYLMADILRRYLEYKEYKVKQIMNITDVGHLVSNDDGGEDKLIEGAKRESKTPKEIANFYTKAFLQDIEKVNIEKAYKYPKATDHIKEIIAITKDLLKKNIAYEINGSVYFDISKFKDYGKLSGNTKEKLEELLKGARSEIVKDKNKKNPYDFALWLKAPKNHLMQWDSPWGKGYPGWHMECTAMSIKYLGKTIDIHTGGEDNIFPHHENEIAQSESYTNKTFVKYWLHKRHLLVDGKKMSKSKGNFYRLSDLEKLGFSPLDFRYLIIQSHYRNQINFTKNSLKQAHKSLNRLKEFLSRLKAVNTNKDNSDVNKLIIKTKKAFEKNMDNDLDTPQALASIFEMVNSVNKYIDQKNISKKNAKEVIKLLINFDQVLGLKIDHNETHKNKKEIIKLVKDREKARKDKNWKKADKIRDELLKLGIEIKDTDKGTIWNKI